jgi:hypothetical protein
LVTVEARSYGFSVQVGRRHKALLKLLASLNSVGEAEYLRQLIDMELSRREQAIDLYTTTPTTPKRPPEVEKPGRAYGWRTKMIREICLSFGGRSFFVSEVLERVEDIPSAIVGSTVSSLVKEHFLEVIRREGPHRRTVYAVVVPEKANGHSNTGVAEMLLWPPFVMEGDL